MNTNNIELSISPSTFAESYFLDCFTNGWVCDLRDPLETIIENLSDEKKEQIAPHLLRRLSPQRTFEISHILPAGCSWPRPSQALPDGRNVIRSAFLRQLILASANLEYLRPSEIQLWGAFIEGDLLLEHSDELPAIYLRYCYLTGRLSIRDSKTKTIAMTGSRVDSVEADRVRIRGSANFDLNFECCNSIRMRGAHISGILTFRFSSLLHDGTEEMKPMRAAVSLDGSHIVGDVDLGVLSARGSIWLAGARINGDLRLQPVALSTALQTAVCGRNISVDGDVSLSGEIRSANSATNNLRLQLPLLDFDGAKIGGSFGGGFCKLLTRFGPAISLDSANVGSDLILGQKFRAVGAIRINGSKVGGNLAFSGAQLRTNDGQSDFEAKTIDCSHTTVGQSIFLREHPQWGRFRSKGTVSFESVVAGGDLATYGGVFQNNHYIERGHPLPIIKKSIGELIGYAAKSCLALRVVGCRFGGALDMYKTRRFLGERQFEFDTRISGSVSLSSSSFSEIVDNLPLKSDRPRSWPRRIERFPIRGRSDGTRRVRCFVELDGLTYERLGRRRDVGGIARKKWLLLQPGEHLTRTFRPQPFEQLIGVLRGMGHNQDANIIAKSKGHRETIAQLNTWRIDFFREITTPGVSALFLVARRLLEPFQIILQWIFLGALAGFGYGTIRIVVLFFAVWLVCGFLYRESARQEGFAPSNPVIYTDAKNAACSEKWVHCLTKPKELNDFNPFAYSADIMIPPLDLGQKKDWDPINKNVKFRLFGLELGSLGEDGTEYIKRAQTIIGWLFLGLLGASLSGIIRRD